MTGTVIAVAGADRSSLACALEEVAQAVARLSPAKLERFARDLAEAVPAADSAVGAATVRAAFAVTAPGQAVALARQAAAVLRDAAPGRLPRFGWQPGQWAGQLPVYLSEGARGRVALLFGGLASTPLEHTRMLSLSMATVAAARQLGIEPTVAVGYGLGEIIGLAWAEAITPGEAARLAAMRAQILRAAPARTAMARVLAGRELTATLLDGTGLVLAADEGPVQQVLAGPAADIRRLPERAAALGVIADVLGITCALHSPVMRPCVMPMEAVAAGIRVAAPRRRLISAVTGLDVTLSGDTARRLARQLERPALLASALALASADADLILLATPDPAIARAAATCCRLPVIQTPLDRRSHPVPAALAALFAAGAIDTVRPYLPDAPSRRSRPRAANTDTAQRGESPPNKSAREAGTAGLRAAQRA